MNWIRALAWCILLLPALAGATWAKEEIDPIRLNNRGIAALKDGKFKESIRLLQQAVDLRPQDTFILENLAMAMNNYGVHYMSDSNADHAIRWLMRASGISSDELIRKNLAQAYIIKGQAEAAAGRPELAHQMFRDAVLADPKSGAALEWLGRSFYDEGRLKEALAAIDDAYKLDARDDLKRFADKIRREQNGESNFFEQRSQHFRIFYSPDINIGNINSAGQLLERAWQDHRIFLGGAPRKDIIAVFYSSKDKFTGTHDLTSNIAGIYDGKVRMPIPDQPNWETVRRIMSHEVAHAFLFDIGGPDIPLWLNEGLAELLSIGPDRPTHSLDLALKKREPLVKIQDLTSTLKNLKNNTLASLAYDESFSIAKFIHGRFGVFGVRRFLQAFKEGKTEEDAIQGQLYMTPNILQQAWEAGLK